MTPIFRLSCRWGDWCRQSARCAFVRARGTSERKSVYAGGYCRRRSSHGFLDSQIRRLGLDDRVTLLGARGSQDVADLYRAADMFCLPSYAEGLPVALMEAMAAGLPVVATRITGIPRTCGPRS